MQQYQKSVRDGTEDFLCPFTDMRITQGSNDGYSHRGIMANDVAGVEAGVRYPYYAPCTLKCLQVFPQWGQSMWQSVNKVRFANGNIDYATIMIAHDDSQDCYVGQVIEQGVQLGNMGTKGNATGVHCHIEVEQGNDTTWFKNQFGNYQFNNEVDLDDCYFVDNTNIIDGHGGNWKTTDQVPVNENNLYICNFNMNVRSGAGTNFACKKVLELTEDGKVNATSSNENDNAVYKQGTFFTARRIINNDNGSVWAESPSGFICIKDNETEYCVQK